MCNTICIGEILNKSAKQVELTLPAKHKYSTSYRTIYQTISISLSYGTTHRALDQSRAPDYDRLRPSVPTQLQGILELTAGEVNHTDQELLPKQPAGTRKLVRKLAGYH